MEQILIIDDDKMICESLARIFREDGYGVFTAHDKASGLDTAENADVDLVFLDMKLPDGSGIDILADLKKTRGNPEVVILTGYADPESAQIAMKNNVWDYLKKPASMDAVQMVVRRAMAYRKEKRQPKDQSRVLEMNRTGIIGKSPKMTSCLEMVTRAAESDTSIFITGETGTGKELFARAIHENSPRKEKPFIVVDCASLPETLAENILFGHHKGAYTSADKKETGLVAKAHGGTLFLDEIGELPSSLQKTFLRVLQEKHYLPLGSNQVYESDFRLISASNRDLTEKIENREFRTDLYYRLCPVVISLPPLRERGEDIIEITMDYLIHYTRNKNISMKGFSPDFFDTLMAYPWPGNVRELINTLEWVMINAYEENTLYPQHLPARIRSKIVTNELSEESTGPADALPEAKRTDRIKEIPLWKDYKRAVIADAEKTYLERLMEATGGDVKEGSRLSGLSVPRLYQLLRSHGISTG